jgi:hypothetical protein
MCGGAAHPATGCAYTPTFVVCWRCTLEFAAWLQMWTNSKGLKKGLPFYQYAGRRVTRRERAFEVLASKIL